MADNQTAAILAAAMIQARGRELGTSQLTAAEHAVEIYLQCVDALADANKRRIKTSQSEI